MKSEDEQFDELEKLLHLKRYEHPPEGYYEHFLDDLHDRQRLEIMQRSAWSLFWDRVETWFWSVGSRKRVYLVGAAYATVMIGLYFRVGGEDFQAANSLPAGSAATVVYDVNSSDVNAVKTFKVPVLGEQNSKPEGVLPAGIKSLLREF